MCYKTLLFVWRIFLYSNKSPQNTIFLLLSCNMEHCNLLFLKRIKVYIFSVQGDANLTADTPKNWSCLPTPSGNVEQLQFFQTFFFTVGSCSPLSCKDIRYLLSESWLKSIWRFITQECSSTFQTCFVLSKYPYFTS